VASHDIHDDIRGKTVPKLLAEPLSKIVAGAPSDAAHHVIIEINLSDPAGPRQARSKVLDLIRTVLTPQAALHALRRNQIEEPTHPYVFAELTISQLEAVLAEDGRQTREAAADNVAHRTKRSIFHVWDSPLVQPLTTKSIRTVKADAAQSAYSASGEGIVWAVLDSGVDKHHPHFGRWNNTDLDLPLKHGSFADGEEQDDPLVDVFGHGTHVAGIIAGEPQPEVVPVAAMSSVDERGTALEYHLDPAPAIRGMAPKCKIMSLRVLKRNGDGDVIALINALEYIQQLNGYGQNIIVHGVNISAGYLPLVHGYASGQTPVCLAVDRLVRSGVCVVVAAGNTGYVLSAPVGAVQFTQANVVEAGQLLSVNDPGNAALAITVGSTHREKPHLYGVSFFSSKGPTADGRLKPDLVAPGENIISCAAGANIARVTGKGKIASDAFQYVEDSGTSMAAPHVSGIIAGFLSIRREYIGRPQDVRQMLISTATDLGRDPRLQGAGLVDLMRLIASV
jgi:subtilisin family serine protease